MVEKEDRLKRLLCIFLPGLLTGIALAVVFIIDGFFPFGKGSVAALDLNTQYLPLLYRFYDIVTDSLGTTIDYHIAGGINLFSESVTELLNPFNYVLILFNRNNLYLGGNVLIILYGMCASLSFSYVINKISTKFQYINVTLSVCYGLSFYMAYQFEIIRWMYLVVLFPIFLLSFKELMEKGRIAPFSILLGYQLILSLQIGIQLCFFTLCVGICCFKKMGVKKTSIKKTSVNRTHIESTVSENSDGVLCDDADKKKILTLIYAIIAGVLISAVNFIPNIVNIFSSDRSSANSSVIDIISRHGLDDILERMLEISNPVVVGLYAVFFFLLRKELKSIFKEFKCGFLLLGILILTVILEPSNLLWHLGSYQCFPVRYGYMVLCVAEFLLVGILERFYGSDKGSECEDHSGSDKGSECEACTKDSTLNGKKKSSILEIAVIVVVAGILLVTITYAIYKRLDFSQAFSTLAIGRLCLNQMLIFYGLMFLITIAAGIIVYTLAHSDLKPNANVKANEEGNKRVSEKGNCSLMLQGLLISVSCVAGIVIYVCILFPQSFVARTQAENDYRMMGDVWFSNPQYFSSGHLNDTESPALNAPLVTGEYSMTAYMPTGASLGYVQAMDSLGYVTPWVSVRSTGGTIISDFLLGISNEYINAANGLINTGGVQTDSDTAALLDNYKDGSTLDNQMSVLRVMSHGTKYEADEILKVIDKSTLGYSNETDIDLGEGQKLVYVCTNDITTNIFVNDELKVIPDTDHSQNPQALWFLGEYTDGTIHISATDNNLSPVALNNCEIGVIDADQFIALCKEVKAQNKQTIMPDSSSSTLTVENITDGEVLLLPFAYLDGYKSKESRVDSYFGGLIKVMPNDNITSVTITYRYKILVLALILSLLGLGLLVWPEIETISRPIVLKISYIAFWAVASIFVLAVYIAPNIGMLGYMGYKVFHKEVVKEPVLLMADMEEDGIRIVMAKDNLVLSNKAKLTADSEESKSFKAGMAADGKSDDSSRWSSVNDWENPHHYLQADLKSVEAIKALRIFWSQTNACNYSVKASKTDSKMEKDVVEVASFTSSPSDNEQIIYLDNCTEARYIRVDIEDVNKNEEDLSLYYQNISISELEIYGEDTEEFIIAKPVLASGTDRKIPIPEVPEGYAVRVGGIDYENLMTEDGGFEDTYSPVLINLGYILTKDNRSYDLPGFDIILPGSENADVGDGVDFLPKVNVREWKKAEGEYIFVGKDADSKKNECAEEVTESLLGVLGEEGYEIHIDSNGIKLQAATEQGMCWARGTLERILEENSVPCGIVRDYPKYSVRGFCIDVARRPVSIDLLKTMVDELAAHKMNTLQLHLNDNAIIAESGYDGTFEGARSLYSAFRPESDIVGENGEPLTAGDYSYSKADLKELVSYAAAKGVEIVPEIDTPAHSMALTKIFPSLGYKNEPELADTLDVSKPEVLTLATDIWSEYLVTGDETAANDMDADVNQKSEKVGEGAVFGECGTIHLGMDEFFGDAKAYESYLINLTSNIKEMAPDKDIRIWGSFSIIDVDINKIPKSLELMIWSPLWANPERMYKEGFKIINCTNSNLYIIVGGGTDHLNIDDLKNNWEPNRFTDDTLTVTIPSWSDRMLGASYSMWNDNYTKGTDTSTEDDLLLRFSEPLDVISARLW